MKSLLQTIFLPILRPFESGEGPFIYKSSHRTILIAVGSLFLLLSIAVFVVGFRSEGLGFLLPSLIFGSAALISLVIGGLGSNRAVAKLWGSR